MSSVLKNIINSFKQEGTLTSSVYKAVQMSADTNMAVKLAGEGTKNIGFIYANPIDTNANVDIVTEGGAFAICGTAGVTRGDYLKSDSSADMVTAGTDKDEVCARALASAVDGDVFPIEIVRFTLSK